MSANIPTILALDFDGVLCDGLIEYFQTSKRTYQKIWQSDNPIKINSLAANFYRLRPVIETGWEMPILLRALALGIEEKHILQDWSIIAHQIVESEHLDSKEISKQLDKVRDEWIQADLESWLELHRFYPGVIERLQQILDSPTQVNIVTTKEERFVRKLLRQQGIELPTKSIFGKDIKRPKYETLRLLIEGNSIETNNLWFVEDRLEALQLVQQQPDLQKIRLYLASWGYNTQQTRDFVVNDSQIQLLSLEQFNQDFLAWH
jgi:phosphoglycolate phosphatase-like HAD superfamily hydrolase